MVEHAPLHVLLVDDSSEDRELLTEAIQQAAGEARVVCAATADEGLELARTVTFDMLLLDLPPPQTLQVLTSVRELARNRLMPVVVVTGRYLEHDERAAYELQANAVLKKGMSFGQLRKLAQDLLHFWRAHAERQAVVTSHQVGQSEQNA